MTTFNEQCDADVRDASDFFGHRQCLLQGKEREAGLWLCRRHATMERQRTQRNAELKNEDEA